MCMGAPHASVMKSTPVNDESRCRILCDGGHTTSVRNLDGRGPEHRRSDVRFHRAGGGRVLATATGLTPRGLFTHRCAPAPPPTFGPAHPRLWASRGAAPTPAWGRG